MAWDTTGFSKSGRADLPLYETPVHVNSFAGRGGFVEIVLAKQGTAVGSRDSGGAGQERKAKAPQLLTEIERQKAVLAELPDKYVSAFRWPAGGGITARPDDLDSASCQSHPRPFPSKRCRRERY
jgi:hypothetical protein